MVRSYGPEFESGKVELRTLVEKEVPEVKTGEIR